MPTLSSSRLCWTVFALLLPLSAGAAGATGPEEFSLGTGFTYQGRLQQGGRAAEGVFDLSFELFDAATAGRSYGVIDLFDVPVAAGAFAVDLDFGHSVFSGDPVWLEILVRSAGEGSYTTLDPRHRLAGEAVAACNVNSDVRIRGTLDVDAPGAVPDLRIACCNDVDNGGQLVIGGFLNALLLDNNEIQAQLLLEPGPFSINAAGGNVGIGVASPQAPLHLPGGPDASSNGGGALVLGSPTSENLAMDRNEIMARSNGEPSTLYLNADGGTVQFGGPIDIGYTIASTQVTAQVAEVSCPAGLRVLGGGCHTSDNLTTPDTLIVSAPLGASGWWCFYDDQSGSSITVYAICANVR